MATTDLKTFLESLCPGIARGAGDGSPLVTPLVQSTTFLREGLNSNPPHQYSRVSNPTVEALEKALAQLAGASSALAFASGLAAETALFLALLSAGDHVVLGRAVYGGTTRLFHRILSRFGIAASFVDATDLLAIQGAIRPNTKLIVIETPANPTLELTDIAGVVAIASPQKIPVAVDNTFMTPLLQRPLDHGATIEILSTTKFIDGHSLALGGALLTRDEDIAGRLRFLRKSTGGIQSPKDAWLTMNGLRTLPLRMEAQSLTAARLADWLRTAEGVRRVYYPNAGSAKAEAIRARQHQKADGAVLSLELEGDLAATGRFVQALRRIALVEHVGSVDSLITHPATMTHAEVPKEQRQAAGISDSLLRLSVGLEGFEPLREDLTRGLEALRISRPKSNEEAIA